MKKNINKYLLYYLSILFLFSLLFLFKKYTVENDSTISEWLINYEGGFTKRGLIGQISIFISKTFSIELRESIFIFQTIVVGTYFILLFHFLKNIKSERLFLLAIFTPIFILYPVAEIEVLARKEIFVFISLIVYVFIPSKKLIYDLSYKLFILPLVILIWEPVIFFFIYFFSIDIIKYRFTKINSAFLKNILFYIPAISLAIFIALNPMSIEQHDEMKKVLKNEFNEICYMSCALLQSKSSIVQQFQGNFHKYSFEIFLRYFLIILIGFGPLFILLKHSTLKRSNLFFFKYFKNLLAPFLFIASPIIILFAMGYDWGRWVNIGYVFLCITYFFIYKNNYININSTILKRNFISKLSKKLFIFIFIIFCFGWNPKTVISGDVASFPGYRIPYKVFKMLYY